MEEKKRSGTRTIRIINKRHLCFSVWLLFIFFTCTVGSTSTCLDSSSCPKFAEADIEFQNLEEKIGENMVSEGKGEIAILHWARRLLGGPGSSPPRCNSKCGKCTPCRPVHVPVPPGTPVTAEYYPEAWRCKCGNKLYMP